MKLVKLFSGESKLDGPSMMCTAQGFPDSAKPVAAPGLHPTTSGTAKNVH